MLKFKLLAIALLCFITSTQATVLSGYSDFETIPSGEVAQYLQAGDNLKLRSWAIPAGTYYKDYKFEGLDPNFPRIWLSDTSYNADYIFDLNYNKLFLVEAGDLCVTDEKNTACIGQRGFLQTSESEYKYGRVVGFQVGQTKGEEQKVLVYLGRDQKHAEFPLSSFRPHR